MGERQDDLSLQAAATARRHGMWEPGDRIVVGVSGGPDSVALLHVLNRLREAHSLTLTVAHLNHRLRGPAADEDAAFVRGLAEDWGLAAVVEEADVAGLARRRGLSIQEAAREARYTFFLRVAEVHGARRIALAHHADDQVETVLFRFLRGTGPRGLAGIPPVRGPIIRPFIDIPRDDILRYCQAHGLPFRMDPSNKDLRYRRNRIRWELIPLLEERYNPKLRETVRRLAEIVREEEDFLDDYAGRLYRSLAREAGGPGLDGTRAEVEEVFIPRAALMDLHPAMGRRVLRRALSRLRVPGKALGWEWIQRLLTGREGVHHLPGGAVARVGPEEFHLYRLRTETKPGPFDFPVEVPGLYRLEGIGGQLRLWRESAAVWEREGLRQLEEAAADSGAEPGVWEAAVAWEALRPPLRLRSRLPGDRFQPLGLEGTRKLQDLFVDLKIKRQLRDRIPLLVDKEGIVCVVGHRIAERVKVGPGTREVLRIRLRPLPQPREEPVPGAAAAGPEEPPDGDQSGGFPPS